MMEIKCKYDLYSPDFRRQSHQVFARMRSEDPVIRQIGLDGETPIWFVTRYAEVEHVLVNDHLFVRDPALVSAELGEKFGVPQQGIMAMVNDNMLNRDGDAHRRLRALVSKAFTRKVIQDLRPRIESIAEVLLDRVAERGRMDLISEFAFPLPITVIAEMLGIPIERQDDFRRWSNVVITPALTPEAQAESARLLGEFVVFMQELVAERRGHPGPDLLSGLIHAEEQGDRLSMNELFSMLLLLIVAGHETTVTLISNAVLALLQNPRELGDLLENQDLIPSSLEELLRYDSPVERSLARWAAQDTQLDGHTICKGDLVIAIIGSANRDEARFANPGVLDVHRQPVTHLAFGKGPHYCLGAPLARLEGEIALRALFQRFPDLSLDIEDAGLEWRNVPLIHSLARLPVKWGTESTGEASSARS
jgi:cytochrome P450